VLLRLELRLIFCLIIFYLGLESFVNLYTRPILFIFRPSAIAYNIPVFIMTEMTYTVSSGTLNSTIPYHVFMLYVAFV